MDQIDLHISARCQGWQEEVARLTKQLQHSQLKVTELQKQLLAKSAKASYSQCCHGYSSLQVAGELVLPRQTV